MVVRTHGKGSGSDSGVGIELIDEQMWKFISSEITRDILEQTHVIFGMIKEWIMEIMQEHLDTYQYKIMELLNEQLEAFQSEIVTGHLGVQTPSFPEFKVCRALGFFGDKDPIVSHQWIDDMENTQ